MIITYVRGNRAVDIEFDAMMRMSDVLSSTVTGHPIETGSNVNDHIRKNADALTFDAIISNTPLRLPSAVNDTTTDGARLNAGGKDLAYDVIRDGQKAEAHTNAAVIQFDRPFDRVGSVHEQLLYIADNGIAVNVRTTDRGGFRDYENMAILNVTTPTDTSDGSARTFSFQTQNLVIVDTKKVNAPQARKQKTHKGEKGKKEVKQETEPQKKALDAQAFDGIAKWLFGSK